MSDSPETHLKLTLLHNHHIKSTIWLNTLFLSVLFGILIHKFYKNWIWKSPRVVKLMTSFNGPPTIPFFGNSLLFAVPHEELLNVAAKIMREYGRTYSFWFCNKPFVTITEAKYAEKLLTSIKHIDKSEEYDYLEPWLGTGLLTARGKKWHIRRKLLTPSFHFKILEDFIDVFNEQTEVFLNILDQDFCETPDYFDISPLIMKLTLDIICETAMGRKVNVQMDPNSTYLNAVHGLCDAIMYRLARPWLRSNFIWQFFSKGRSEKIHLKALHGFTEMVIRERKEERIQSVQNTPTKAEEIETKRIQDKNKNLSYYRQKKRLAFLDLLLDASDNGKVLSDLDIREEADTFVFEGFDTTSGALNWFIFLLGSNLTEQKRLVEELDEIFGDEKNRPVTMNDLSKMKVLECCIKETLRLFPSVPFYTREMKEDLDLGDGKIIPAGSAATLFAFGLHRDPSVFDNPEEFRPDRFTPENAKGRNPFAYVPFSAGPRNCIGQKFAMIELKIVLAKLFLNYRVESGAKSVDEIGLRPLMILRAKNGIKVKIFKRF